MGISFIMKEHRSQSFISMVSTELSFEALSRNGVILTETRKNYPPYKEVGSSELIVVHHHRSKL